MHETESIPLTEYFPIFRNSAYRKFKYGKERSPRGLECECTQKERSTSITKQLVFQYPFCRETSCNRVLERFILAGLCLERVSVRKIPFPELSRSAPIRWTATSTRFNFQVRFALA